MIAAFSYWFLFSAIVAAAFLIFSTIKAVKDEAGRKYYVRDIMLAVVWLIFYVLSLGH